MNINQPFFYIMLPTFNRPKLASRAVKSILSQNYRNYELVIFNDGSTEDYNDLEKLIKHKNNLKYIKSTNVGINKSRNIMLNSFLNKKNTKNAYFFTLSDDDYLLNNNTLELIANEIKNISSSWYCFNCISKSQNIFKNTDFTKYTNIKYSDFIKNYQGDKHFVFKLDHFKKIRYPEKHFKNGFEHIFYHKIPSKIQIIPKSVKIIEYYNDGLSLSDLYKKTNNLDILTKHIRSSPFQLIFYINLIKYILKPKNIIKEIISENKYYAIKKRIKRYINN